MGPHTIGLEYPQRKVIDDFACDISAPPFVYVDKNKKGNLQSGHSMTEWNIGKKNELMNTFGSKCQLDGS